MRKRHLRAGIRRAARRIMAAACAAFVWAGCATIPPASVGAVEPKWEPFAEGVAYAAGRVFEPRLEFWAVRAALGSPRLHVAVNAPGESPGSVASVHTASFARSYGCAAAINATPFRPASAKEGVPLTVVGSAVSEGVEVAAPRQVRSIAAVCVYPPYGFRPSAGNSRRPPPPHCPSIIPRPPPVNTSIPAQMRRKKKSGAFCPALVRFPVRRGSL